MTRQEQIEELTKIVGDESVAKRVYKAGYIKADGVWKQDYIGNSAFIIELNSYDTEHDLKKAKKDIERVVMAISELNIHQIVKVLAPYRMAVAKQYLREHDENLFQGEE